MSKRIKQNFNLHNKTTLLLATNGSQGICALRELYAAGFQNSNISVITFESSFNKPFIEFLKFQELPFTSINSDIELDQYFVDKYFDILLSVSFRFIFTDKILRKIKRAAVNFHPGILPDYRGSFSIPWAIINDEKYVGYTFHYMSSKVDCGEIIFQEKVEINNDSAFTLNYKVFQKGLSKLGNIINNLYSPKKKEFLKSSEKYKNREKGKFYYNKLPFNGEINFSWDELFIERFIRAMYFPPFKSAFLKYNKKIFYFNNFMEYRNFLRSKHAN